LASSLGCLTRGERTSARDRATEAGGAAGPGLGLQMAVILVWADAAEALLGTSEAAPLDDATVAALWPRAQLATGK
jgi:hypothetical protein